MHPRQGDWPTLIVTYICTLLSLACIAIRLICRRIRGERYWAFPDDIWMGVSVVPLFLRLGLIHVVIVYGTNQAPRMWTLGGDAREERILGSKFVLASRVVYPAFLWCMKACILAFLSRLMSADPKYARAIQAIGVGLVLTFIGVVFGTLLECRPFERYYLMPGPKCAKAFGQLITMGVLGVATDLALIILPLPLIFKSRLPVFRKVQLSLLFMVSFAVIIITVIRMPLIVHSKSMQDSRTLWASVEIFVSCLVANAPILNNFYFEWKNKRRGGTQMADDDDVEDEERGSGYSMKPKLSKPHLERFNSKSSDSMGIKGHARDLSKECLTRTGGGTGVDSVIEAGAPLPNAVPQSLAQPPWARDYRLGSALSSSATSTVIKATTSVTQSVALASPEVVRTQQSRYYKGDFLGTQVWADQVFPGPKDPSQRVNCSIEPSHQSPNNGAHVHHHTVPHSHSRRPSHSVPDIPSLGVLPSTPPRLLLNSIANRKAIQARRGSGGQYPVAAGIQGPFPHNGLVPAGSEEELGGGTGSLGANRMSSVSNFGIEEGHGYVRDNVG